MIYKAKLKSVSDVDAGGQVEIWFEGYIDGELKYPFLRTFCSPENIEQAMELYLKNLVEQINVVEQIPDGLEINFTE